MTDIHLIPKTAFDRVRAADIERDERFALIADMSRANALAVVKRAGSGHLGSSFSAMEIVTLLYEDVMNTLTVGLDAPDRDIYFSSKGHDCPGFYAALYALGVIDKQHFIDLRRIAGACGHPDVKTPGVEANSGSLGMGIAKGKGLALAKRLRGDAGDVFVLTGDGEWQEGQNYESLQSAAHHRVENLVVIMDHNKLQTDLEVSRIIDLGNLDAKLASFGWHVARCDGHDLFALTRTLAELRARPGKPKLLIADTIKGKGVSFMEHPAALAAGDGLYPWHSGAPDDATYERAHAEILGRVTTAWDRHGLGTLPTDDVTLPRAASGVTRSFVAAGYGAALLALGHARDDVVVLDADLSADCRLREFEHAFPERFFECGIAEQDMVSTAGGSRSPGSCRS